MVCKKCGGYNFIENYNIPIHNVGTYCAECGSWIKWGPIVAKKKVDDGKYVVTIINAEEKSKNSGEKFIMINFEISPEYSKIQDFIWKDKTTKKYNKSKLDSICKCFELPVNYFINVETFLNFLIGKKVKLSIAYDPSNKLRVKNWAKLDL